MKKYRQECYKTTFESDMPEKGSEGMKKMCEKPEENGPKMHQVMKCSHDKMIEEMKQKDGEKNDEKEMKRTIFKTIHEVIN